jgi:murein DD-endopeptidase MepM/ murein hydrolase activator NlpD
MRLLARALLMLVVLGGLAFGGGWYLAGREPGPTIAITAPDKYVGQATPLQIEVDAPGANVSRLEAAIEQNGQTLNVFAIDAAAGLPDYVKTAGDRMNVTQMVGKKAQPQLAGGAATLTVTASRPVFFGLRTATSRVTRELQVRLEPPRIAVVSLHHYINLGGAEFVVMRATPADVQAGIRVGDASYPAYPGSSVGLADPALRVAFFALRHDQKVETPITAVARDAAGNEATTYIEHKPFPKAFVNSRIPIDQAFLERVVPPIASNTPSIAVDTSTPEGLLKGFLLINGELRKANAATIAELAAGSRPEMLWKEAFAQIGNSQVESRFADRRTYTHDDKEIDHQVHLGFDLASVQQAPVHAANRGVVAFADFLGIYGNCVIIDHGLGVQSLYGHMSQIAVEVGDTVEKGQELGRTGSTGLAGGDHLHFTVLLQGTPVNPVEWWDPHWMDDRVFRKVREAGGTR